MTVWQMQGIKSISFNRCSGGDRSGCVGQSVSASGFAFMPSFYTGFGKSALVQVNLGLPGMQTAWPQSGIHYSRNGAQTYQNMITIAMWKAETINKVDYFDSYLQNVHFQRRPLTRISFRCQCL